MIKYYILKGKEVVETPTPEAWIWLEDPKNRVLRQTHLDGDIMVSSVFLCIDHGFAMFKDPDDGDPHVPVLFETMIFGGWYNDFQERYTSYDETIARHEELVEAIKQGLPVDALYEDD